MNSGIGKSVETGKGWSALSRSATSGSQILNPSSSPELFLDMYLGVDGARFSTLVRSQQDAYILTLKISVSWVHAIFTIDSGRRGSPIDARATNSSTNALRLETKSFELFHIPRSQASRAQKNTAAKLQRAINFLDLRTCSRSTGLEPIH